MCFGSFNTYKKVLFKCNVINYFFLKNNNKNNKR